MTENNNEQNVELTKQYRIVIKQDKESKKFIGEVPELPECKVEGESWEEVLTLLNDSIEAKLNSLEYPPTPIDEVEWDGKLTLSLSKSLYRELAFLAKYDEVTPEELAAELISEGMGRRYGGHRFYRNPKQRKDYNNHNNNNNYRRKDKRMSKSEYYNIMENKADFLEYVRNLEKGKR